MTDGATRDDRKNRAMLSAIAAVGSVEDVAERAGLTKWTLYGWINKRHTPSVDGLARLARVTGRSMEDLVDENPEP